MTLPAEKTSFKKSCNFRVKRGRDVFKGRKVNNTKIQNFSIKLKTILRTLDQLRFEHIGTSGNKKLKFLNFIYQVNFHVSEAHLKPLSTFIFLFLPNSSPYKVITFYFIWKLSIQKVFKFLYFPLPFFFLSQPLLETLIKDKR